jgi:hypothetical protein
MGKLYGIMWMETFVGKEESGFRRPDSYRCILELATLTVWLRIRNGNEEEVAGAMGNSM